MGLLERGGQWRVRPSLAAWLVWSFYLGGIFLCMFGDRLPRGRLLLARVAAVAGNPGLPIRPQLLVPNREESF